MNRRQLINQQRIIAETIRSYESKSDVMEYISMIAEELLPVELPTECRIAGCLSDTYFRAHIGTDGFIRIEGSSQSIIMRGVIKLMADALNDCDAETIKEVGITWVNDAGLLDMLTPQRQGAIRQMAERIYRACGI